MSHRLAVITGCSSGIGLACARSLLDIEWRVIGISRRIAPLEHHLFEQHICDLTDCAALAETCRLIRTAHNGVDLLLNSAGLGRFAPHEEVPPHSIVEMVGVNLLAPMLLTRELLRPIKSSRGWIINIASFSAHEASSFGAAYAATKAGLRHFGVSLFEEVRRAGVKVLTISPDITKTPFYEGLSFEPDSNPEGFITPECVAAAVINAISSRPETVITEILLRPQRILIAKNPKR